MTDPRHTNRLIHESSPYLRQHAHNPVDWHPWNEDTLQKARSLDRMLLISIGYSACHWCHVMEKESFGDEDIAGIMNKHFICIKVDREERPDVDQVYMHAVRLVTGSGGWPLNCFALPDGRPFFGGTYFQKSPWKQLLENIALLFQTRRGDLESQAESLTRGIRNEGLIASSPADADLPAIELQRAIALLADQFDRADGGLAGVPKFPMPVILQLLLRITTDGQDEESRNALALTLKKMAFGGIYDQIGGGFARYSTDSGWKVPHFEKMLYDNAQLVSVYSRAYQTLRDPLYRETVEETLEFIKRELTGPEGAFYSSLDADSEGEEGRFYTWTEDEIRNILPGYYELMCKFYHVGGMGLWENGRNILVRTVTADEFAQDKGLPPAGFRALLGSVRKKLLKARSRRVRPELDHKIIVSWNAMMARAYTDAFLALGNPVYLECAVRNTRYLLDRASGKDGGLTHLAGKNNTQINGFLEDYAFMIDTLIHLYQADFREKWLYTALQLTEYVIRNFHDPRSDLFFFTSRLDAGLVSRKTEYYDNVIPSSNSVMAKCLFLLGTAFDRQDYLDISGKMLARMKPLIVRHLSSFSGWASLWLDCSREARVVAACGPGFREKIRAVRQANIPGILYFGSEGPSELPYLQNRFAEGATLLYYCTGKECRLPTDDPENIINLIRNPLPGNPDSSTHNS